MNGPAIDVCIQALEPLCVKVAMSRQVQLPSLADVVQPPAGATLWSSGYARLLLWPVATNQSNIIARAADEGEGWLDALLAQTETLSTVPLDGYLVLALPAAPAPEADEEVRKVELSARICRKHLVWPSSAEALAAGAGPWARIADITALGLPDAATAAGDTLYWPEIGHAANALWLDLQERGASAVARADAEEQIPTRGTA
ncbi:hypothetical protein GR239_27415 [Rhizobium leguminosarum]|uniref:hypothetical protein n=1 Tax=Rhizobium ruizarguesonis TaxID=2081791 RepID=UPI0013BE4F94|nr:hypothetical protein [Rhizobium ruizarguesonis]NEK04265.1 hypothetical protein [Rhizobium ruizarguesonis]